MPENAGRVLDFGGGVGATSATLKAEGRAAEAVLFDQVADTAVPGIDAAVAVDLEDRDALAKLLSEHGPFDTILCLDILEHLRDPWATVAVLKRALNPGGSLIISLPNVNFYRLLAPLIFKGRFDYTEAGTLDRTHLRWFALHGMIDLATADGMELKAVSKNIFGRRWQLFNTATLGLIERFLVGQYKIRADKPRHRTAFTSVDSPAPPSLR